VVGGVDVNDRGDGAGFALDNGFDNFNRLRRLSAGSSAAARAARRFFQDDDDSFGFRHISPSGLYPALSIKYRFLK
jgi:hypothetical protein